MDLFCAIDVLEGRAVRLVRGELGAPHPFGDPLALARRFLEAGARWLHVVDLDAARSGEPVNGHVVRALVDAAHEAGARVQTGGGVRDMARAEELLGAGADRVVLGTAAIEGPELARALAARHPGRVAVGLDYRRAADGGVALALRGWTEAARASLESLLALWEDAPLTVVVTAIERDGTRQGPDTEGLSAVLDATELEVVASGGVGRADDLRALGALRSPARGRRVGGVIVGRALADGSIGVGEAVAACAASG
jgi:phosphoribosylformimino-5-aminoimidazole carboxamide ribotide isomerase